MSSDAGDAVTARTRDDLPQMITGRLQLRRRPHARPATRPPSGYVALRKALEMGPEAVHDEVKAASLLGRGGAGFPAGVKWGFCPPDVWPRYLVVNGDESEPGTYKDRLLMERDPHQLIEGVLIGAYAVGCAQVFLYVRGEMAHAQERIAAALNEAYAAGLVGKQHPRHRLLVRRRPPLGCRRLHRRRGDRAHRVASRATGACPASSRRTSRRPRASTCSRRSSTTSRRCPTCRGSSATGPRPTPPSAPRTRRGTRMFAVSGHVKKPGVFEVEFGTTTFRDLIYGRLRAASAAANTLKAFIPGGASAPWFYEEHLDLPARGRRRRQGRLDARLGRHRRHGRHHRRGRGRLARRAVLRPRVLRQVHAVPRGHDLAGEDPAAHARRPRPARGPRPAARPVRQHQPGDRLAAEADHHLPARPVGRVAHRQRHRPLPRRVPGLLRRRRDPDLGRRSTAKAYVPPEGAPIGPEVAGERGGDLREDHRRRTRDRGPRGRAGHRRRRAARHLHPPLLLPPADEPGGHVPHVPRRDRHRPRAGPAADVHDPGVRRHDGRPPTPRSPRRPRTASSSSCSPTTRSTARSATRAASARCRTRPTPTARASPASSRRSATSRSRSRSATSSTSTASAASSATAAPGSPTRSPATR